jgi:hypothetical protein
MTEAAAAWSISDRPGRTVCPARYSRQYIGPVEEAHVAIASGCADGLLRLFHVYYTVVQFGNIWSKGTRRLEILNDVLVRCRPIRR